MRERAGNLLPSGNSQKSPGGRKKEGRKKNKYSLSPTAITKAKRAINEKLQNLKSLLHKDNIKAYGPKLAMAVLALSCILEAMYYNKA